MKVLFYKLLRKKMVPVPDYSDRIIAHLLSTNPNPVYASLDIWDYVKKEFNAEQVYSWRESQNYLKFNNERDYIMFLLRV